jgi:hypothetical protein
VPRVTDYPGYASWAEEDASNPETAQMIANSADMMSDGAAIHQSIQNRGQRSGRKPAVKRLNLDDVFARLSWEAPRATFFPVQLNYTLLSLGGTCDC